MQKLRLEYSFRKNVYTTFLDLKKFGELHPYMITVTVIAKPENNSIEYEIFEEVTLFGFIKLKPYYKAKVTEVEKGVHIQYTSEVRKNVFLTIDFKFVQTQQGTKVIEEVEVKGNPIVISVLINTIKKAHTSIFERLKGIDD